MLNILFPCCFSTDTNCHPKQVRYLEVPSESDGEQSSEHEIISHTIDDKISKEIADRILKSRTNLYKEGIGYVKIPFKTFFIVIKNEKCQLTFEFKELEHKATFDNNSEAFKREIAYWKPNNCSFRITEINRQSCESLKVGFDALSPSISDTYYISVSDYDYEEMHSQFDDREYAILQTVIKVLNEKISV